MSGARFLDEASDEPLVMSAVGQKLTLLADKRCRRYPSKRTLLNVRLDVRRCQ
jgi:hypothetical protein